MEKKDPTQCPSWGHGGQYIVDPVSGLRRRVDVTPPAPDTADVALAIEATSPSASVGEHIVADGASDAATAAPQDLTPSTKEKKRA